MDAPNTPPEALSPPETAEATLDGAGGAPYPYIDANLNAEAIDGRAGAWQGIQALDHPAPSENLASLAEQSAVYAARAFGPGTQRAYRSAWSKYSGWCAGHGLEPFGGAAGPLPLYVTHSGRD
jgi:hypothetical protein